MKLSFTLTQTSPETEKNLPPIILLHGRLDSKKTWIHLAPTLSEKTGRKVYALDMRNHGESAWSDEMTFDILANDLDEFMSDQGIPKAVLVGHSLGGRTSITLALTKPDRVEKLFVEDMTTSKYSSLSKTVVQMFIDLLRDSLAAVPPGADEEAAKVAIIRHLMENVPQTNKKEMTLFERDTLPLKREEGGAFSWQANVDVLEEMLANDKTEPPRAVYDGESLFLYGTESFFDVEKDESIFTYFPRAKKVGVEGAGHLIHHNFPEEFLDQLVKFINLPLNTQL